MHPMYIESEAKDDCPICCNKAMKGQNRATGSWSYICARCGIFRVTDDFLYEIPNQESASGKLLYRLIYQFRRESQNVRKPIDLPLHYAAELPNLLSSADPSVENKLEALLILLGRARAIAVLL